MAVPTSQGTPWSFDEPSGVVVFAFVLLGAISFAMWFDGLCDRCLRKQD